MEDKKAKNNPTDERISDEQLQSVTGGSAAPTPQSKQLEDAEGTDGPINSAHQRRLEQIDNPELAQ